ncbi:MAG TPA: PQQ-binding-like beta-propeller repeat protein [Planctomycetota bacterium]|nr:PQQ-binding-like beta-propeller repeat protein [Planctomycetota bacterium]
MRTVSIGLATCLCVLSASTLLATETENQGMSILPTPGKVVIDGKFDDWDLTGGIFAVNDVENLRDQYGVWFYAMYDAKNIYLLARWNDPAPMNNPGSSKGDMGFQGDCLQVRFITHYEQKGKERVTHITAWRDRDGLDVVDVAYGRNFNEGGIRDAQEKGAQQEFAVYQNGKGYVQEIAIPWAILTSDGQPLQPGDQMRMALEPNYTAGAAGRVTIKDIFLPNIVPDRVFTFRAYGQWGIATLEKTGKLQPRTLRLADHREFAVGMENGLPAVDWAGLEAVREIPGFKPVRFTMPADGYVSLNIYDKDGAVARHLLNWAFYTKGEHEVKWDGLTTPNWRTPGQPVEPGDYTWRAITHPGIGLRLRGWACNGGNAPWDNGPSTNWGGDHGVPHVCTTDGEKIYLGWTGSEAGRAVVACDLAGNVQWKHTHGGMGGAEQIAVDGGIVFVLSHGSTLYRLDTAKGSYATWKGKPEPAVSVDSLWDAPAGMPDRIEGMDARDGSLYITCSSTSFRRNDVKDWKSLLTKIIKGDGMAATIREKVGDYWKRRFTAWGNGPANVDEFCASPNYYTPDFRDHVIGILNAMLGDATVAPGAARLTGDRLAQANRKTIEQAFPGEFIPLKTNFLAVLDAQTGKPQKFIELDLPRFVRAASPKLVYVVTAGGTMVTAVDPTTGVAKPAVTGLTNAKGIAVDADGRIYMSVDAPDHQVKVFTADGKPAGGERLAEIGRKGGYPPLGPWVSAGMRNPAGMVVDRDGKLWVMEATMQPKRVSVWEAKSGKLIREFFGPTHYGASGGAINPRDPNIMVGEGCEWRIDPKTGRAACLGIFEQTIHKAAMFGVGSNGRLYLAVWSDIDIIHHFAFIRIFERLGDGNYALRTAIRRGEKETTFWADENGDQQEQPGELTTYPAALLMHGYLFVFNVGADLSICATDLAGKTGMVIKVGGFTACGAPKYDLAGARKLPALGGAMATGDGKLVFDVKSGSGAGDGISCYDVASGKMRWTYPNPFSGVHGSHAAPPPEPGLLRGVFGTVGTAVLPGPVNAIVVLNGNCGEWHLLTGDGFYLTKLFEGDPFKMAFPDQAVPGAILDACPPGLGGEDFGGSMRQGADGEVYIQAGKTALWNVEVVGLDQVKAIPGGTIPFSAADVTMAQQFHDEQKQSAEGTKKFTVKKATPAFTGSLDGDFRGADKLAFEKQRGSRVRVAAAWDDANLYVGWEVQDDTPWVNGADAPEFMYARGDTVDLQLGTDPKADPKRGEPVKGDLRLSIGSFQGKPVAVVYRMVADEKHRKTFSSGVVKEYTMDSVLVLDGCKIDVKVNGPGKQYVVEAAIPLAALGLKPADGLTLRGDFGVTHGDKAGADTALRTHWNNQQTGIVNDEVFELKMEPKNWGEMLFK